jgi:hypothetical protein
MVKDLKLRIQVILITAIFLSFSQISVASLSCELDVSEEEYNPGETVKGVLNIRNLNYTGLETNVLVTYSIEKDKIIIEKTATIPLGEERTKILELNLPDDLDSGEYFFKVGVEYLEETFEAQDSFFVKGESSFPFWIIFVLIFSIGGILLYKYKL